MDKDEWVECICYTILYGGIIALILAISCAIWVGKSYFEMQAFNRHSTTKASLQDAMFSELRILAD
jgi:hypothetical protein